MKYSKFSAVIIGSGIAGLYAALKIEQQLQLPNGVLLITKSKLGESNSYYAQGGMVAVLKENEKDSVESHVTDTIKAGAGLSELDTIRFISENSDKVVKDLLKFGVEFDRDENGKFTLIKLWNNYCIIILINIIIRFFHLQKQYFFITFNCSKRF